MFRSGDNLEVYTCVFIFMNDGTMNRWIFWTFSKGAKIGLKIVYLLLTPTAFKTLDFQDVVGFDKFCLE